MINLIVYLTTAKAVKLSPDYVCMHLYYALRHRNEKKTIQHPFSELKCPELKQHRFSE